MNPSHNPSLARKLKTAIKSGISHDLIKNPLSEYNLILNLTEKISVFELVLILALSNPYEKN